MWQHRPAPAHHDPLRDIYGPMSCSGGEAGCCSWRCFSVIHLLVEVVEGAIFGVCAFAWIVIMVFGDGALWENDDAAATNLLIGPWNAAAATAVLVVVSFVSCVCCCVGERAVKAYKVAMLVGAAIASLRFLGVLLLLGGKEHCDDYMYDQHLGHAGDYVEWTHSAGGQPTASSADGALHFFATQLSWHDARDACRQRSRPLEPASQH